MDAECLWSRKMEVADCSLLGGRRVSSLLLQTRRICTPKSSWRRTTRSFAHPFMHVPCAAHQYSLWRSVMGSEGGVQECWGGRKHMREAWDSLGASGRPTGKCHSTRVWVDVMEWGSLKLQEVLQAGHDSEALLGPSLVSVSGWREDCHWAHQRSAERREEPQWAQRSAGPGLYTWLCHLLVGPLQVRPEPQFPHV